MLGGGGGAVVGHWIMRRVYEHNETVQRAVRLAMAEELRRIADTVPDRSGAELVLGLSAALAAEAMGDDDAAQRTLGRVAALREKRARIRGIEGQTATRDTASGDSEHST